MMFNVLVIIELASVVPHIPISAYCLHPARSGTQRCRTIITVITIPKIGTGVVASSPEMYPFLTKLFCRLSLVERLYSTVVSFVQPP
jgi:hypothetical protein